MSSQKHPVAPNSRVHARELWVQRAGPTFSLSPSTQRQVVPGHRKSPDNAAADREQAGEGEVGGVSKDMAPDSCAERE